jgi:hypothetical protein
MKKLVLALAIGCLALCGCARHYVMTLNNGSQIDTHGKPKVKGGFYVYKDALGREGYVSTGRVREIAPASMVERENERFIPTPGKR